jgi:hypothetical protein
MQLVSLQLTKRLSTVISESFVARTEVFVGRAIFGFPNGQYGPGCGVFPGGDPFGRTDARFPPRFDFRIKRIAAAVNIYHIGLKITRKRNWGTICATCFCDSSEKQYHRLWCTD